jgi:hypothetical protein
VLSLISRFSKYNLVIKYMDEEIKVEETVETPVEAPVENPEGETPSEEVVA